MFCPKNEPHPPPIRLHLMCSITPPSQPLRATGPWGKQCGDDLWPGLSLLWGELRPGDSLEAAPFALGQARPAPHAPHTC